MVYLCLGNKDKFKLNGNICRFCSDRFECMTVVREQLRDDDAFWRGL